MENKFTLNKYFRQVDYIKSCWFGKVKYANENLIEDTLDQLERLGLIKTYEFFNTKKFKFLELPTIKNMEYVDKQYNKIVKEMKQTLIRQCKEYDIVEMFGN